MEELLLGGAIERLHQVTDLPWLLRQLGPGDGMDVR